MSTPITLTTQQQAALDQMIEFATGKSAGLFCLEGYAGVGKTYLVAELLKALKPHRLAIAVAAPTNKAVGVLEAKVKAAGASANSYCSIHSLLGLQLVEREDGSHDCKPSGAASIHEYDLVVVDECSMISADMLGRIVLSRRNARILFVGDPAQLPPVDASGKGEISPTFTRVNSKAVLTQVVRQAADNPIIALSMVIRGAIEAGRRMGTGDLLEACPGSDEQTTVGVMSGGESTVYNIALGELRSGVDCRIVAFTNRQVQSYNQQLHVALYGSDTALYAPGERVLVHEACEVRTGEAGAVGMLAAMRTQLHTSEELVVLSVQPTEHPWYRDINTLLVELQREDRDESKVFAWVAVDPAQLAARVAAEFDKVRELKVAKGLGERPSESVRDAMAKAWALKKAFAGLRHVYAMTAHKSQGSTIDTVVVDLSNLNRIRDTFDYNRALYVATTRAGSHLALVA